MRTGAGRRYLCFRLGDGQHLNRCCAAGGGTGGGMKTVLREAFAAELIKDDELWLAMLSDRNSTAHIFNEQLAIKICHSIQENYVIALENLCEKIKIRLV